MHERHRIFAQSDFHVRGHFDVDRGGSDVPSSSLFRLRLRAGRGRKFLPAISARGAGAFCARGLESGRLSVRSTPAVSRSL